MIRRIGFFHFANGYDPLNALRAALPGITDQALIVLPESFNLGFHRKPTLSDPGVIIEGLKDDSRSGAFTFVAGITLPARQGRNAKWYSSAYLFRDGECKILCHKSRLDGSETYDPCPDADCDVENPVCLDLLCLGALVCVDSDTPSRCNPLKARLSARTDCATKVIAIPACMYRNPSTPEAIAAQWPGEHVVLANSDAAGLASFVACNGKIIETAESNETTNRIVLRAFTESNCPSVFRAQ